VTAVAIPPSLALGGRRRDRTRMLDHGPAATDASATTALQGPDADGLDSPETGLAL
jgi:hypothetical protein